MTRTSPSRRSQFISSPERQFLSDFLHEDRNNELSHRDALAAAQAEHERVREAAIRVYHLHEMQEEHQRIVEAEQREQKRLAIERKIAADEVKLQQLRATSIPKPTPPPEPPKQPEPERKPEPAPPPIKAPVKEPVIATAPASAPKPEGLKAAEPATQSKPPTNNPFSTIPQKQPQPPPSNPPAANTNGVIAQAAPPTAKPSTSTNQTARSAVGSQLLQIHKELKKLRSNLQNYAKTPGSPLKGRMGEYRREIRVSIGQLTSGKGANTTPINKITTTLKKALENHVPSPPIGVSAFVVGERQPVEGATNNEDTMPALFIYLINICAKGIINQFINEASANTKAADPIGVFTALIFSQKEFQWRGQSLIDILMAKFRVVCPVLFGYRGNDKMEGGRVTLGWKRDGTAWITEQNHNDRMTGLGAGYASIALRDFSKASKANPYPPTHYWQALAGIINTPENETSNTQYVVLRSMIEGHEQRFINFYGNAAIAALRLALIEFPKKAPKSASASGSVRALADMLSSESGLVLV